MAYRLDREGQGEGDAGSASLCTWMGRLGLRQPNHGKHHAHAFGEGSDRFSVIGSDLVSRPRARGWVGRWTEIITPTRSGKGRRRVPTLYPKMTYRQGKAGDERE